MPTSEDYISRLNAIRYSAQINTKADARRALSDLLGIEKQLLQMRKEVLEDIRIAKSSGAASQAAISVGATLLGVLTERKGSPARRPPAVPRRNKHPEDPELSRVRLVINQLLTSIDSDKRRLRNFVESANAAADQLRLSGTTPCKRCGAPVLLEVGVCAYCGNALI